MSHRKQRQLQNWDLGVGRRKLGCDFLAREQSSLVLAGPRPDWERVHQVASHLLNCLPNYKITILKKHFGKWEKANINHFLKKKCIFKSQLLVVVRTINVSFQEQTEYNHFRRTRSLQWIWSKDDIKDCFSLVFLMEILISKHLISLGANSSHSAISIIRLMLKVFVSTT